MSENTVWYGIGEYSDGSVIRRFFADNPNIPDSEIEHRIECWLIERNKECTYYSVVPCSADTEEIIKVNGTNILFTV